MKSYVHLDSLIEYKDCKTKAENTQNSEENRYGKYKKTLY